MDNQCISTITELSFVPMRIEEKTRTIKDLFYSAEVSTINAFEQSVCGTGTDLPFEQPPESGGEYKEVLMPSKPEVMQEVPILKSSEANSLRFMEAMPANDDETLRLQIILNRHYLNYLNAQFGLINIEYNSVINHSITHPVLSTLYTSTGHATFIEDNAKDRVTGFLAMLPTASQDFRFSMGKLKLNEYPPS